MNGVSMRLFQSLLRRAQSLIKKDSNNIQLNEELQFHLERLIEENMANGMSPEQARVAAKANFGSIIQATEACHEARVWLGSKLYFKTSATACGRFSNIVRLPLYRSRSIGHDGICFETTGTRALPSCWVEVRSIVTQ
jgi:hypothetical protein